MSHISGTLPGTLYSGVHFVTPLIETVQNIRSARQDVYNRGGASDAPMELRIHELPLDNSVVIFGHSHDK